MSAPSEKSKTGVDLSSLRNSVDHTSYRSATMRRVTLRWIGLTCNSCQRTGTLDAPTVGNLEALKRVARYLMGHGRLVQEFVRQVEEPSHVVVFTDSDHEGRLKTCKSTSSSKSFYGFHMLRSASTEQGVIALRWGESEFYALVKGTSAKLGAVSMLKNL